VDSGVLDRLSALGRRPRSPALQTCACLRHRPLACGARVGGCFLGMLGFRALCCSLAALDLMLNPLRSEQEAFRFLLWVLAVAVVIVGAVLLIRAL
jgi:hypothetical protein